MIPFDPKLVRSRVFITPLTQKTWDCRGGLGEPGGDPERSIGGGRFTAILIFILVQSL